MKHVDNLDKIFTILLILDILLIMGAILFKWIDNYGEYILLFDTLLCAILIIQFIMKYRRAKDKNLFFRSHWLDLFSSLPIALVILPFLSSTLYTYNAIILVRFLRLFLLLKLFSQFLKRLVDATYLDKFIAIFIVIILSSILILYYFDPSIVSLFDAVWFIFQTISTVGYGDVYPVTILGKILSAVIAILGIGLVAVTTDIL